MWTETPERAFTGQIPAYRYFICDAASDDAGYRLFSTTGLTQAHFEVETTMSLMLGIMLSGALLVGEAPDMHVETQGLNMARPGEAMILAERIRTASRDWCSAYRVVLTPNSIGDPGVCEREMRRRAYVALSRPQRIHFVRAGGQTALNRR